MIKVARTINDITKARDLGIQVAQPRVDFMAVMERVRQVIQDIEPHDAVERYRALGVNCVQGKATIISPWEVEIDGKSIYTRNIVIASGAQPLVPSIPGLDQLDYLTSDNLWDLKQLPKKLLVLGGGPVGCELAQAFSRLGSSVIIAEMMPRLLSHEDGDASAFVQQRFVSEGIHVLVGHKTVGFTLHDGKNIALLEAVGDHGGSRINIEFDQVLIAVGRRAHTRGLGLEKLGIELNTNGTVMVDDYLRSRFPNIYACGDVAGPYQFTHTAAHQAWYVVVNALFGQFKTFKVDYSVIPWTIFTDPEVAHVGLSEADAIAKDITYDITRYSISDLDRAIADNCAEGFVKILTVLGKDKILGVTIVGYHAGELLTEFVTAMKYGLGLKKILGTIHSYPTISEANQFAAGEWSRSHAPKRLLRWAEKYHTWQRQ